MTTNENTILFDDMTASVEISSIRWNRWRRRANGGAGNGTGSSANDISEGLAVRRGPSGETFLYIISDDNYSARQRTLLLMFEFKEGN